ncbi:hypothetical protein D3C80_1533090 [compost metagenome]
MEAGTKALEQPGLQTQIAIPDNALKKRIDERHDQRGGAQLRYEPRPLGNSAGDNGWNGGGERQQKEKFHQPITVIDTDHRGRLHEMDAV